MARSGNIFETSKLPKIFDSFHENYNSSYSEFDPAAHTDGRTDGQTSAADVAGQMCVVADDGAAADAELPQVVRRSVRSGHARPRARCRPIRRPFKQCNSVDAGIANCKRPVPITTKFAKGKFC